MLKRIRRPSPAMVVSLVALFVGLTGTAVGSAIVGRAKLADNALKLQGKTADSLVQQASQLPGPAASAAGLFSIKSAAWSLNPNTNGDFTVTCDPGQKAISGAWEDPGGYGHEWDNRPSPDGASWRIFVTLSSSAPGPQSGTIYAVCVK